MNRRTVAGLLIAATVLAGVGAFAGMWVWNAWHTSHLRAVEQAASAAAAAERHSPRGVQREVVRGFMHDPETAQFRHDVPAVRGGSGVWCGEVNGRNRMGGMVGFTRYIAEVHADRELAGVMDRVQFDRVGGNPEFDNKWQLFCR